MLNMTGIDEQCWSKSMKANRLLLLLSFTSLFPLCLKPLMAGEFDPLNTTEFNRALNLAIPTTAVMRTTSPKWEQML